MYAMNQRTASRGVANASAPSGATNAHAPTTLDGTKPPSTTMSTNGRTSIAVSCVNRNQSNRRVIANTTTLPSEMTV